MTLANMRENGVRSVDAACERAGARRRVLRATSGRATRAGRGAAAAVLGVRVTEGHHAAGLDGAAEDRVRRTMAMGRSVALPFLQSD
jgi:hypothetical protein